MGTRSNIGMKQEDGTIKAIYCHWDGYPEHVGATLAKYYKTPEMVEALLNLGDISSLASTLEETARNAFATTSERGLPVNVPEIHANEEEWMEFASDQSAEYIYLFQPQLFKKTEYEWNYKEVSKYWKHLTKYAEKLV